MLARRLCWTAPARRNTLPFEVSQSLVCSNLGRTAIEQVRVSDAL